MVLRFRYIDLTFIDYIQYWGVFFLVREKRDMKQILAGSLMVALAMSTTHATITVYGDKEMLEGYEGHVAAYTDMDGVIPTFDYVSGASVQISTDPEYSHRAIIIPSEVAADTESTIRITAGGETVNYSFKVVNEAEPEPANGKTIAQCTFYNDYRDHTGFAGTGAFSFDKQTVNKIQIESLSADFIDVEKIISTTRKLDKLLFPGLPAFQGDGALRLSPDYDGAGQTWYSGFGYEAGQLDGFRRGPGAYLNDRIWTTRARDFSHQGDFVSFWFSEDGDFTNDSAAYGHWSVELEYSPEAYGGGYFDCTLSDEGDLNACGGIFDLPNNQWRQISLPCHLASRNTVSEVFSNIPGTYGQDWAVYRYNRTDNSYFKFDANAPLEQGEGSWIIQKSGDTITLAMPQGSIPTLTTQPTVCTSPSGCVEIPLITKSGENQWSMIGFPYDVAESISRVRITSNSNSCNTQVGCNLNVAKNLGIVHNQLWHWVDAATGYARVGVSDTLSPWNGYWSATLPNSATMNPVKLVVPKP